MGPLRLSIYRFLFLEAPFSLLAILKLACCRSCITTYTLKIAGKINDRVSRNVFLNDETLRGALLTPLIALHYHFLFCNLMSLSTGGVSTINVAFFPKKNFTNAQAVNAPADAPMGKAKVPMLLQPVSTVLAIMPPPGGPQPSPSVEQCTLLSPSVMSQSPRPTPSTGSIIPTPSPSIPRPSLEYYKAKSALVVAALVETQQLLQASESSRQAALSISPSPLEAGVVKTTFHVNKRAALKHGNVRITSGQGSLRGLEILPMREATEEKLQQGIQAKQNEMNARKEAYALCKDGCKCETPKCAAAGLYYCVYCNVLKKKLCGVSKCMEQYKQDNSKERPIPQKKITTKTSAKKRKAPPQKAASDSDGESDESMMDGDSDPPESEPEQEPCMYPIVAEPEADDEAAVDEYDFGEGCLHVYFPSLCVSCR